MNLKNNKKLKLKKTKNMNDKFIPLQFVRPIGKPNRIGIVTQISGEVHNKASVQWIGGEQGLKTAWWKRDELETIDSLPRLLSNSLKHNTGFGDDGLIDKYYPLKNN